MCFTEFIGYTCGHTSLEILRPCPLTTQFLANPICATYGRRSILAQEMCPACQRILHGRAVLILEWEHHWMHERGVCGCPVIFPDLIQARIIAPSRPLKATQPSDRPAPTAYQTIARGRRKNNRKAKVAVPKNPMSTKGGTSSQKKPSGPQGTYQPHSQEKEAENIADKSHSSGSQHSFSEKGPDVSKRLVETQRRESKSNTSESDLGKGQLDTESQNMPAGVPARIHSLYGAEWIDEHRQLHNAGSCKCAADFSYYQTPKAYGTIDSSLQIYTGQEQLVYKAGSCSSPDQIFGSPQANPNTPSAGGSSASGYIMPGVSCFSGPSSDTYGQQQSHIESGQGGQLKPVKEHGLREGWARVLNQNVTFSSHQAHAPHSTWSQQPGNQHQAYQPSQTCQGWCSYGQHTDMHPGAQNSTWSTTSQQPGLPANIGQPVRSSGAIYQVDLTKSTNPLYNYACTEGGKQGGRIGHCVDLQNLDYVRAKDAPPPLVGLPIGAGPEAPEYMEHMGSFDHCVLRQGNKCKQSHQGTRTTGATKPQEPTPAQQPTEPGQIGQNFGFQTVGGLIAAANDTRDTRLTRLTHKKSASAACATLPWNNRPPGEPGHGRSSAARSKDGIRVKEEDEEEVESRSGVN